MACKGCRARKIKCDSARPTCQNCRLRASHCTYVGERRIRRFTDVGNDNNLSLISRNSRRRSSFTFINTCGSTTRSPLQQSTPSLVAESENLENNQMLDETQHSASSGPPVAHDVNPEKAESSSSDTLVDRILNSHGGLESSALRSPAVWMRADDGDEYTGPSSGISAISDVGLDWIRNNVPESDALCQTIQEIRNGLLSHLRRPKCIPSESPLMREVGFRARHISQEHVTRYVDAYFSEVQTIFPILDRETFQNQLEELGTDPTCSPSSWMTLLNAVLASGCRAVLSDETAEAFRQSGGESWYYFQNALSYEADIIHQATDLMAVQAMAVLTVYAQGLSSPQRLEYTLCSIAARLAQGIALNLQPGPGWNLSEEEIRHRNRTFWVIYVLDKTIALRCGRPCMIQDDEVSCDFPHGVHLDLAQRPNSQVPGQDHDFNFFLSFAKLARMCGTISRRLYSATALTLSYASLSNDRDRITYDLGRWRESIPEDIQPGKPFGRISDTRGLSHIQLLVLHSTYHYALCATNRRFAPLFAQGAFDIRESRACETISKQMEAARSMILLIKHLDVESFTPAWLCFYYPFTALSTIFVNVVLEPSSETVNSDIALMEVVVGFFGRLEYITSGIAAFTKTREFVRQARAIIGQPSPLKPVSLQADSIINAEVPMEERTNAQGKVTTSVVEMHHFQFGSAGGTLDSATQREQSVVDASYQEATKENHNKEAEIDARLLYTDMLRVLDSSVGEVPSNSWLGNWAATPSPNF
ncbi:hypothetical protein NW756_011138 [Fusarium oxysporum]|nr:hypothetical protein NW763_012487 [Fusarium oxysporum]KAJ4043583.1 hypothetical protein NW753_010180 [Fusarium oxysporum]KAJ4080177.1 hypothetical protein NW756_011138 [Fusarium oxysporum]